MTDDRRWTIEDVDAAIDEAVDRRQPVRCDRQVTDALGLPPIDGRTAEEACELLALHAATM